MPEYRAPGIYMEETSFPSKSIDGVNTSTVGFVGPTRLGPVHGISETLTSLADFEGIYGSLNDLQYGPNYLAHSVRAYFENGGKQLHVSRVLGDGAAKASSAVIVASDDAAPNVRFVARTSGEAGNGVIKVQLIATPVSAATLLGCQPGSLLRFGTELAVKHGSTWHNRDGSIANVASVVSGEVLTMMVSMAGKNEATMMIDDLGFDREHPRWIGHVLAVVPEKRIDWLQNLYAVEVGEDVSAFELFMGLLGNVTERSFKLTGGSDGTAPNRAAYEAALAELGNSEYIATIAAPGHSAYPDHLDIQQALIAHAETPGAYRMVVLDTPPGQSIQEVRALRGNVDSSYAALYYPWVVVDNPLSNPEREGVSSEITLPPSGFVCGIYARNDLERGVHKAPANEVMHGVLRLERDISDAEQAVLNPIGVNCLRHFDGRGYRVWGARTTSSDPEWKYVNVRRYLNFLEASIDHGTQWAVFEPNSEQLWSRANQTISDFLFNEWKNGALIGSKPENAFFVRCDRSSMSQVDIDDGRLICLIGVAVLKPSEFMIFRVGQNTAGPNTA